MTNDVPASPGVPPHRAVIGAGIEIARSTALGAVAGVLAAALQRNHGGVR